MIRSDGYLTVAAPVTGSKWSSSDPTGWAGRFALFGKRMRGSPEALNPRTYAPYALPLKGIVLAGEL